MAAYTHAFRTLSAAGLLAMAVGGSSRAQNAHALALVCDTPFRTSVFDRMHKGDVGTARAMAAEAVQRREGCAAFVLAETYDPLILSSFGDRAPPSDPERALNMYEIAEAAGVADAAPRSERLLCFLGRRTCDGTE